MLIEEVNSSDNTTFNFEGLKSTFPQDKSFREYLLKWGLDQSLQVFTFRFDLKFDELQYDRFLVDFFNSPDVRASLPYLQSQKLQFSKIHSSKLSCSQTKTDMFDVLQTNNIVVKDSIRKTFGDIHEEIEISDLLRESLIMEDSQLYTTFSENDRIQLLFKIFQILVLGGQLCQYEDNLSVYLNQTKLLYKNMVTARKDPINEQIYIESNAFEILQIEKCYSRDHPQNVLLVVINPSLRQVNMIVNQWIKFW